MNGRARGRKCAACGAPIRGGNICDACYQKIRAKHVARNRAARALRGLATATGAEPCGALDCIFGHPDPGGMGVDGCRCGRATGAEQATFLHRLRGLLAAMAAEIFEARAAKGDHGEA